MTTATDPKTYRISKDRTSISCLICGSRSHNLGDIQNLFCGRCGMFHSFIPHAVIRRIERLELELKLAYDGHMMDGYRPEVFMLRGDKAE